MPKTEIDYSNTIIYKITCKDVSVNDLYVGHTTNFVQRKHAHKNSCINQKSCNYNCKLYDVIRNKGGWNNWKMEIIGFYECADHYEARKKEQEFFILLNATLNSIEPFPKQKVPNKIKKYYCELCNLKFTSLMLIDTHNLTTQHKNMLEQNKETTEKTKKTKKNDFKYSCKICDFKTCKKTDFERHNLTQKHKNNILTTNYTKKNDIKHKCENCEKEYNDRAGLWRHKKICEKIIHPNTIDQKTEFEILTNLVLDVVKQNKELTQQNTELTNKIVDICKIGQTNNITNSNFNSNNKTFNLQFFLNETCKDAMNIMDFVDSIKLQLSDLEKVGRLGYVEGISSIITSNLKALDVTQRPVHCTDKKRETLYIKDENKWEKEDEEKKKIRKAIKKVASKNARLLPKFKEAHPDCSKSVSKFSDQYNKIIVESMGGSGDNDIEKEDKIIKNITNYTTINKE